MELKGDVEGELETKITTQTFAQAGGVEAFPDLEIGGVVTFNLTETYSRFHAMWQLNNHLGGIAKNRGYTHIFGVVYERDDSRSELNPSSEIHIATGTGYRPKK